MRERRRDVRARERESDPEGEDIIIEGWQQQPEEDEEAMDGGARAMGWLQVFMFSLRPRALIRRVALEKGISRSFRDARTPLSPLLNPGSLPLKYALEHPALAHSARILAQADSVPLLGGSPPGLTGRNKLFLLHLSYLSLSFFLESFPFFFLFFFVVKYLLRLFEAKESLD